MNSGLHAFRVRPRIQAKPSTTASNDALRTLPIHSRRAHTKSKGGCERCKQRHKKCDESRPVCSLCAGKGLGCIYIDTSQPRRLSRPSATTLRWIEGYLPRNLWPGARSPIVLPSGSPEPLHTEHDLFLINHYIDFTAVDVGKSEYKAIYSDQAFDLARENPFLMHAMIALAACHLQHLGIDARQYRLPEAFHAQKASEGLRKAVVKIEGPRQMDSILTTAILLNCLTFCAADYREEEILTNDAPRWDWLRLQIGITDLLVRSRPFHPESIWNPLFKATKTLYLQLTEEEAPANNLASLLAAFCGIDSDSTPETNAYVEFHQLLVPVVCREPSPVYYRQYINSVGGITHEYIDLLEAQDEKALMLFVHWLSLMISIDSWWCSRRTRRECRTICTLLLSKLRSEDMVLLERPLKACGLSP